MDCDFRKICLILPSMGAGGMERVMSQLASYFVQFSNYQVYLIILTKQQKFYSIPDNVTIIEPEFNYRGNARLIFTFRIMYFLRRKVKSLKPDYVLSFGGKYNSFVILSLFKVRTRIFISDRSQPGISYGLFLDYINPLVYKFSHGIVAQTIQAKCALYKVTRHRNIKVIGNPISVEVNKSSVERENIILNVGRFISSKHQELLVDFFDEIDNKDWKLYFIGDGPKFDAVKERAQGARSSDRIFFIGKISNVAEYYQKAKIFAFTSVSEGFPNVLGEAMGAGLACISFDCLAGPADLIDNNTNGFLVPINAHTEYISKLQLLMEDESLIKKFSYNGKKKIEHYDLDKIGQSFLDFFNSDENIN